MKVQDRRKFGYKFHKNPSQLAFDFHFGALNRDI